jgi:hypothetical protein
LTCKAKGLRDNRCLDLDLDLHFLTISLFAPLLFSCQFIADATGQVFFFVVQMWTSA